MFFGSRNPFLAVSQSYHVWVTSKIQINFRFYMCSMVLMIGSYGFSQFFYFPRFWGWGIYFWQFHEAIMFGWLRKSRSTSGFTGAQGYWWLRLMDFRNFFISYVFEVEESIFVSFTKLVLCSGDLENLDQLPVSQVLKGTDDCVLWIFVISSFPTFLRSKNLFLKVLQSWHVWMTSEIQVNFPIAGARGHCFMDFRNLFIFFVFEVKASIFGSFKKLLVWVSSKIQVNFRFHRCSRVFYGFS